MKKQPRNRILAQILLLLAAALLSVVALASEAAGSITVRLHSPNGEPFAISGAEVYLYRAADFSQGRFLMLADYAASGVDPNSLATASEQSAAARTLADFIERKHLSGILEITNSAGTAQFANLSTGLYLLRISARPHGKTEIVVAPFFVSIPMENPDASGLIYDVLAKPKAEASEKPPPQPPSPPHPPSSPAPPDIVVQPPPSHGNLPQTGQNPAPIWISLPAGILLIARGGAQVHRGRKERGDEEN